MDILLKGDIHESVTALKARFKILDSYRIVAISYLYFRRPCQNRILQAERHNADGQFLIVFFHKSTFFFFTEIGAKLQRICKSTKDFYKKYCLFHK